MDNQFHWPILGQEFVKQYLQKEIICSQFAHAYIFTGLSHLGKKTVAEYFAASINCQNKKIARPCWQCASCIQIQKRTHPDVIFIQKSEDKSKILIGQIRELQRRLSLKSFITKFKVAIISDSEFLNEESANSLLKTIEEPYPNTIFILTVVDQKQLPLTITSRCQLIKFNSVPTYKIENWLISQNLSQQKATTIAGLANGCPGLASILLNNQDLIVQSENQALGFISLLKANINEKIIGVNELVGKNNENNKENIINTLEIWLSLIKDILYLRNGQPVVTFKNLKNKTSQISSAMDNNKIIKLGLNLLKLISDINKNVNSRLALENFLVNI